MSQKLDEAQIQAHLADLPAWARHEDSITRTYSLTSFPAALAFASAVGHLAEALNHHPDILIKWKQVTLTLSTHSAGGLTALDFQLAGLIEGLPMKSA